MNCLVVHGWALSGLGMSFFPSPSTRFAVRSTLKIRQKGFCPYYSSLFEVWCSTKGEYVREEKDFDDMLEWIVCSYQMEQCVVRGANNSKKNLGHIFQGDFKDLRKKYHKES